MVHGVIMAGGSGTRFWPESRKSRPKQLLDISGNKTMIRATVERILPEIPFERIMVVTGASHAQEIKNQLPELNDAMVVAEPQGKNTAPCIALAAYKLFKKDADGVMVVLPADHMIGEEEEFRKSVRSAVEAACMGDYLTAFGIVPDRPETGYGYIELGESALEMKSVTAFKVKSFTEKPDKVRAEQYLENGTHIWNSGMFVWKITTIIEAFEKYLPSISRAMTGILPALNTREEPEAIIEAYNTIEEISIDYGIIEKAANVLVIPIDVKWNDVGCWASLADVWDTDDTGNSGRGEFLALDSTGCIISSPHKVSVLVGVEDLIVVDTADALLVCRKDRAQDLRRLQERLEERGYEELL